LKRLFSLENIRIVLIVIFTLAYLQYQITSIFTAVSVFQRLFVVVLSILYQVL